MSVNFMSYNFMSVIFSQPLLAMILSGVRLLLRAIPRRHFHDPHDPPQSLLHHQPHLSLSPHLRRLFPRLLPPGRIRRKGQPRDHHPPDRITILLALVVFLLIVGETLPPTPDAIPVLGQ